jgi:transcriptional regulator with XRE-family HTH domain
MTNQQSKSPKRTKPPIEKKAHRDVRVAWRREPDEYDITEQLGIRINARRTKLGWSLTDAANATGIPQATLSRIENNKMSPTFALLVRLMRGFDISIQELVGNHDPAQSGVSRSSSDALPYLRVKGGTYIAPHIRSELDVMLPSLICTVKGKTIKDVGGLVSYHGIEFCYALSGSVVLHIAGQ